MRRLGIFDRRLNHADVVRNVAVDGEKVGQAVEVVVKEECAEGQRLGRDSGDAGSVGASSVNRPEPSL